MTTKVGTVTETLESIANEFKELSERNEWDAKGMEKLVERVEWLEKSNAFHNALTIHKLQERVEQLERQVVENYHVLLERVAQKIERRR